MFFLAGPMIPVHRWFLRMASGLSRRFRRLRLESLGVICGRGVWIQSVEIPRNYFDIDLGAGVALDRSVTLLATGPEKRERRIVIGAGSYINRYTMIDASESISIGRDCMIGPYCYITDHDHGKGAEVPIKDQPLDAASVVIGDDVWIGAHAVILKGVTVGKGAVIGAGAVVTRNVSPNTIVVGIPARPIGVRNADCAVPESAIAGDEQISER